MYCFIMLNATDKEYKLLCDEEVVVGRKGWIYSYILARLGSIISVCTPRWHVPVHVIQKKFVKLTECSAIVKPYFPQLRQCGGATF